MELIKKTILQAVTTGSTSGCEDCAIIKPDYDAIYNIKLGLVCEAHDFGFFDAFVDPTDMSTADEYSGYGGILNPYVYAGDLFVATVEPVGVDNLVDRYLYYGYNYY